MACRPISHVDTWTLGYKLQRWTHFLVYRLLFLQSILLDCRARIQIWVKHSISCYFFFGNSFKRYLGLFQSSRSWSYTYASTHDVRAHQIHLGLAYLKYFLSRWVITLILVIQWSWICIRTSSLRLQLQGKIPLCSIDCFLVLYYLHLQVATWTIWRLLLGGPAGWDWGSTQRVMLCAVFIMGWFWIDFGWNWAIEFLAQVKGCCVALGYLGQASLLHLEALVQQDHWLGVIFYILVVQDGRKYYWLQKAFLKWWWVIVHHVSGPVAFKCERQKLCFLALCVYQLCLERHVFWSWLKCVVKLGASRLLVRERIHHRVQLFFLKGCTQLLAHRCILRWVLLRLWSRKLERVTRLCDIINGSLRLHHLPMFGTLNKFSGVARLKTTCTIWSMSLFDPKGHFTAKSM